MSKQPSSSSSSASQGRPPIHGNDVIFFRYEERITTLTYSGIIYALTVILAAQFIFLNLHFIIGAILTVISIVVLIIHMIMNTIEIIYLEKRQFKPLHQLFRGHQAVAHIFICIVIPFLIWACVLMFIKGTV